MTVRSLPRGALFRALPYVAGIFALGGGLVTLLGWTLDIQPMTDWEGSGISMMPNAAVCAMSAGAALICLQLGLRPLAALFGAIDVLIGGATLVEYVAAIDLGIDRLIAPRDWGQLGTMSPGRMGPPGCLSWTVLGLALCLSSGTSSMRRVASWAAVLVVAVATLSLTGYAFDASRLHDVPHLTTIAAQTASMIAALGLGLAAALPDHGVAGALLRDDAGGLMLRRLVLPVTALPLVTGWVELSGERAGIYDSAFGTAMFALVMITSLTMLVASTASAVSSVDQERARAVHALESADRRKDEFLAILAHELRNPLAPLRNVFELMRRSTEVREVPPSRAVETMGRQLAHLVRLVDDLMDVIRITNDRLQLRPEPRELGPILQQAAESVQPLCERDGQELRLEIPDSPIRVMADPGRLAQAFGNLLNNANKYTDRGGRITLRAELEGREAVVTVLDTGVGIPADQLDNIFGMFSQVDSSLTRSHGGLGIGLALARRLIELHGGTIAVRSDGAGQGTAFVVRTPVTDAPLTEAAPEEPARAVRRILVVDDNVDSADSLAQLLALDGNQTEVAYDGEAAIERVGRFNPHVVMMDIGMPVVDGYEACRRIRDRADGRAPFMIALSGWGQDADRQKSKDAGFDAHLVKPADYDRLTRLLDELTGAAGR